MLLRLKSLKALRLTIFHPRGSTDSELWIRVQPSDFPRLVHHCKSNNDENVRCLGREAEELLPEADTFPSKRKTNDVLGVCIMNSISVGFERLTNTALR